MQTLLVGDKEFQVSEKLTVAQWMQITQLDITSERDQAKAVCIVFGMPVSMADLLTPDIVSIGIVLATRQLIPNVTKYNLELNGHKLQDFNRISLGDFIDLEVYLDGGKEKNLDKIIGVLYQAENTLEWYAADVLGAIIAYQSFRRQVFNSYKNLFSSDGDGDEEHTYNLSRVWYDIIMALADGKFNLIEQTINRPVFEAFNWLAWNKDRIRQQQ